MIDHEKGVKEKDNYSNCRSSDYVYGQPIVIGNPLKLSLIHI